MDHPETVKVNASSGSGYIIINKSDYDADKDKYTLYKQSEADKKAEEEAAINRNSSNRNPSGTYSEPTPTDIRFPDKNATEFENNHGAFIGQSASELRQAAGMADVPGGLAPHVNEAVKDAEAALTAAINTDSGVKVVRDIRVESTVEEPAPDFSKNKNKSKTIVTDTNNNKVPV